MKYFVDVTDGKVPPFYCDCVGVYWGNVCSEV